MRGRLLWRQRMERTCRRARAPRGEDGGEGGPTDLFTPAPPS